MALTKSAKFPIIIEDADIKLFRIFNIIYIFAGNIPVILLSKFKGFHSSCLHNMVEEAVNNLF